MFLNFANEFKTGFENRKWNYLKRKWNYFSYFLNFESKNFFYKMFLNFANEFKTGFENRIWNYFPYFLTSNQKTSLTKISTFQKRIENWL